MTKLYNTLAVLSILLTPVAMMATAGWEAYAATLAQTGIVWLAVATGLATAAALECIGILAGETALMFHGRADHRWRIAAAVLLAYVAAGIYLLRATPLVFLPVLAGAVYVLVGLRAQAQRETAAHDAHTAEQTRAAHAAAEAEAEWKREQWRSQQTYRTEIKLAEIHARAAESQHRADNAGIEPALERILASIVPHTRGTEQDEPAQSGHVCEDCGRTFATTPALNAHRRFCTGSPLHAPAASIARSNGHIVQ